MAYSHIAKDSPFTTRKLYLPNYNEIDIPTGILIKNLKTCDQFENHLSANLEDETDIRCLNLINNVKPAYIPDYNYLTFRELFYSRLEKDSSTCLKDLDKIQSDLYDSSSPHHFQAKTFYQSWGASPGYAQVQSIPNNEKKDIYQLNSFGLSSFDDGNYWAAGSRYSCISSYREKYDPSKISKLPTNWCSVQYLNAPMQSICVPETCIQEMAEIEKEWKDLGSNVSPWFPGDINKTDWLYRDPSYIKELVCNVQPKMQCESNQGSASTENWDNYTYAGLIITCIISFFVLRTHPFWRYLRVWTFGPNRTKTCDF